MDSAGTRLKTPFAYARLSYTLLGYTADGLELTRTVEAVTDEDVESYVNSLMTPEEVTDEGATVQEGDTVNIAYEGTQDGVAFEGGTSESADLVIGSGRFIDGF